jgi:hypothetical protein
MLFKKATKRRVAEEFFNLSKEEFWGLKSQPCFYCNKWFPEYMSIDRVDNEKGYFLDNCVSACSKCNQNKGAVTLDMCRKILGFVEAKNA